jgi:hypothetical protein
MTNSIVVEALTKRFGPVTPVDGIDLEVTDAIDPKRHLSPTPSTPIGDVAGVADSHPFLSLA